MNLAPATCTRRQRRMTPAGAAGAVVLAAYALLSARAARADFPLPLPHEIHREVLEHVHDVLRTIGRIPEQILRENVRDLEVFLGGSEYYGPHHHNHLIYNFPVWIDGSFSYRPYTYCNDHLYGSYDYRPQFWFGWGDESQARWSYERHGYYPYGDGGFQPYGDGRSTPGYSRGFDSRHYDSRRYPQDRSRQGRRSWQDDGRHDSRSWDRSQRYDSRRPGEWGGQQRYDDRRPREWRQPQRQDNRRPSEWRQPQGQDHRRPELRSDRGNRSERSDRIDRNQPKRSNPREVRPDRKQQHDSKSDSRHDSRQSNGSHPSWRDHN